MGDVAGSVERQRRAVGWFAVVVFAYYYKAVAVRIPGRCARHRGARWNPHPRDLHQPLDRDHRLLPAALAGVASDQPERLRRSTGRTSRPQGLRTSASDRRVRDRHGDLRQWRPHRQRDRDLLPRTARDPAGRGVRPRLLRRRGDVALSPVRAAVLRDRLVRHPRSARPLDVPDDRAVPRCRYMASSEPSA